MYMDTDTHRHTHIPYQSLFSQNMYQEGKEAKRTKKREEEEKNNNNKAAKYEVAKEKQKEEQKNSPAK